MFFGMLYLPESPRWLVSSGRPLYEALEAAQFVNSDLTSEQIVNMKKEIDMSSQNHTNNKDAIHDTLFCSDEVNFFLINLN